MSHKAAWMSNVKPTRPTTEFYTHSTGIKFANTVTKLPLKLSLSDYRSSMFLLC